VDGGRACRLGAASTRGGRAQIVDDIDPGVETPNGYALAPSDAEAERAKRARSCASLCGDLDVHGAEGVGLRGEREDTDEENCERDERNASYFMRT